MQKDIKIDNIERSFAKTGNEKIVFIVNQEKYQFWRDEKGDQSQAFKAFEEMKLTPGSVCQIEYIEEPENFTNSEGKTINWTKRSIRGIFQASGNPTPPQVETPRYVANSASQGESREDYGRRLAVHGMVNGLLASGTSMEVVKYQLKDIIQLEDAINEALEGRFFDRIDVEDIPF